jgi:hypothetical protein
MDDKGKTTGNPNTHAAILLVIGIILFILGILIVSIHGAPLRGSGVGTIAIIAGIVLLIIAYLRFRSKRAKLVFLCSYGRMNYSSCRSLFLTPKRRSLQAI